MNRIDNWKKLDDVNRVDNWKKLASPEPCVVCGLDTWAMRDSTAVHFRFHCEAWGAHSYDRTIAAAAAMRYWGERRDEANAWGVLNPMPWCASFVSGIAAERASFDPWSRGLAIGHTRREVDDTIRRITVGVMLWRRGENDVREVIVRHGGHIDDDGEIVWPRQDDQSAVAEAVWPHEAVARLRAASRLGWVHRPGDEGVTT